MKQTTLSIIAATLLLSPIFGAEELGEITVTSTNKLPQKLTQTTASVTVITAEEIEERGYQNVPEILAHTSGFSIASTGGSGQTTSVFIRGLASDNLLILLDGIPLTDYTQPSAAASLEHISISSIERIEIVKGAQSGIWGAGAAAGTVNIITKGGQSNYANLTLKTGSNATYGIGIDISKKTDRASLSLQAAILDTDSISAVLPDDAEDDSYRNKDLHLKSSFAIDPYSTISFFYHRYNGVFDFDDPSNANDTTSSGESDQILYGIGHQYQKERLHIDTKISRREINRHLEGSGTWGPWVYDTTGNSTRYELTANYALTPQQSITAGIEHTINTATTDAGFGASSAKFKNSAAFLSYSHTIDHLLGAKTTFNAVVRYDDFDQFDDKATYRIGIRREYDVWEGIYTSSNIYTGYKAPSLYQFSNASGLLTPESIEGYEFTIGYKKLLKLTYFSNQITDKIESSYDPATYATSYFNNGDGVETTGIELSGEYAFGESGFVLSANWTHMLDFEDTSGKPALRIPENSANLDLDYYFHAASHIGLNMHYEGERRDMDYNSWPASDVMLESYSTVNLTYNTRFNENLSLTVTAKNIFDKEYETVKGYSTEGRSIYATMEYRF